MAASSTLAAPAGQTSGPRSIARSRSTSTPSVKSGSHAPTSTHKPSGQVPLSRRLLFPHLAPGVPLPPLLASPDAPPELDAEIYDFVALALRAFVNPWWTKLTRYDKDFLPQITRILTVVVRQFEERLITAELSPLVLQDIPTIINQHYRDYRNAAAKLSTSYAAGGAASLPQLFHQLQPHMAVSVDGQINEEYIRQVVDHLLKVCLPAEDYEPETERFIVREIVIKILLGNVVPKLTQPWFIQKTILDLLGPSIEQATYLTPPPNGIPSRRYFSIQSIVVFVLSAVQAVSGFCLALIHAYRQARIAIKTVNELSPTRTAKATTQTSSPDPSASAPGGLPLSHSQSSSEENAVEDKEATPRISTLRHLARSMSNSTNQKYSLASNASTASPPFKVVPPDPFTSTPTTGRHYARPTLLLLDEILQMHKHYASGAVLRTLEMVSSAGQPFLDKLLPYVLYKKVLCGAQAVNIVHTAKRTLFPNGWPAPPPVDPTPEEQVAIQAALIKRLAERLPGPAGVILFGPDPTATVESAIEPLSSQTCNTHLILFIIDLILLTLFPEMGVGGANYDEA